jgi:hypothetical protein
VVRLAASGGAAVRGLRAPAPTSPPSAEFGLGVWISFMPSLHRDRDEPSIGSCSGAVSSTCELPRSTHAHRKRSCASLIRSRKERKAMSLASDWLRWEKRAEGEGKLGRNGATCMRAELGRHEERERGRGQAYKEIGSLHFERHTGGPPRQAYRTQTPARHVMLAGKSRRFEQLVRFENLRSAGVAPSARQGRKGRKGPT